MEPPTTPLKYTRLPSRFIRLFGLNPGKVDDPIEGILIQQNLEALNRKDNPFLALSYVWGDAINETETITVKNVTTGQTGSLTITASLHDVLRNIRDPHGATGIWVDQICIDQSNNEEKGEQILSMRLIYERATWLVAWLQQGEIDLAMDLLQGIEWSTIFNFSEALDASLKRIGREPTRENRKSAFQSVNTLLGRAYWRRTWIWQEATAQLDDGIFLSGHKQIRLRILVSYIVSCKQYVTTGGKLDEDWDIGPILGMTKFLDFWLTRKLGIDRSLLALLDQVRQAEVTDPRDKVFAVLPFASDADDFRPAYQMHTHAVYTRFALWHIIKYQSLDVITFSKGELGRLLAEDAKGRVTTKVGEKNTNSVTAALSDDETVTLASWVPDWRVNSFARDERWKADLPLTPLEKAEHIFDSALPRLFKASGSESPSYRFSFPDEQTLIGGLTVHGVKVATFGRVQRARDVETFSLEVEEGWYRDFQAANVSNWDYSGDHLFKRTVYVDTTIRNVKNIPRHARSASPDTDLTWPHHSTDEFLGLGALKAVTRSRAPFYTKWPSTETTVSSLYGLGPLWAQSGDEIWILKGASVPMILRHRTFNRDLDVMTANLVTGVPESVSKKQSDRGLFFVGECFVLGLMDGEVVELMRLNDHDPQRAQVPELEREFHPVTLY